MEITKGIMSQMDEAILSYETDIGVKENPFNEKLQMTKQEFEDLLNEIENSERSTDIRIEAQVVDQHGQHKWKDKKGKKFHEDMHGKSKNHYTNNVKQGDAIIKYRGYQIEITN